MELETRESEVKLSPKLVGPGCKQELWSEKDLGRSKESKVCQLGSEKSEASWELQTTSGLQLEQSNTFRYSDGKLLTNGGTSRYGAGTQNGWLSQNRKPWKKKGRCGNGLNAIVIVCFMVWLKSSTSLRCGEACRLWTGTRSLHCFSPENSESWGLTAYETCK